MIGVELSRKGTVALSPQTGEERKLLIRLKYVLYRSGRFVTYWTYLSDLRRDLPNNSLNWHPALKPNLARLLNATKNMTRGDDDRVLRCFADGLSPHGFQLEAIHAGLNSKSILIADDTGLGKQQPVDSLVLTPSGWRKIGDLEPGDEVTGSNGRPTRVTGVHPQGVKPSYRVTMSDGASVEAGPEHLWSVRRPTASRGWTDLVLTTEEVGEALKAGEDDLEVPILSGPVEFADGLRPPGLPTSPYSLGAMLAGGAASTGLGIIPESYLRRPVSSRVELLNGIMDAAGVPTPGGLFLTARTRGLAESTRELVECLGGTAEVQSHEAGYLVRMRLPGWVMPFSLDGKARAYSLARRRSLPSRTIASVEYVRDVESTCISVAAQDRLYATEHAILTHNTIETIGIMLPLLREGLVKRAILVVPSGVKHQWAEEIEKFSASVPEPLMIARSKLGPRRRRQLYRKPWRVLIINPELVRIDRRYLEAVANGVGFVALDEASSIRNPEAKITRSMKALFGKVEYKVALTATPVENKLVDLWSVIRWIDPRAFISRPYFDSRYIRYRKARFSVRKKNGNMVRVTKEVPDSYRNLREVESKIRHCYIRRRVSDVGMELPELIVQWDRLDLPKRQREMYRAIKDRLAPKLRNLRGSALYAPLQALRQACNSTALIERKKSKKKPAQVKVDRLKELLSTEFAGEQVIMFTDYERFARLLKHALREHDPVTYTGKMADRDRQQSIESFKLGDRRVLIGTQALERGHNLQNAAIVVNVDLPFNPAAILQRLGRVRRLGSGHGTVRLWNMITNDTVEEHLIMKSIYAKRKLFEGIFGSDEMSDADPLEKMKGAALWNLL